MTPDPRGPGRFHYAGIGGSGMSALAQFQAMGGGTVSGSDRGFDQRQRPEARGQLERLGISLFPQDGTGVRAPGTAALVVSTAVEEQVPDVVAARELGLPILHRSEMLAHFVAALRTIAVSGTSGKSTVVAMIFEILRGAGRDPSVITGGDLELLRDEGLWGNAWRGASDLLVVEADESDGSLVRYEPAVGVVLNLQKDHKPEDQVFAMFETFVDRTRETLVLGADENLAALGERARARGLSCAVFGAGDVIGDAIELGADESTFEVGGARFRLPLPGRHNVENALAAIAACRTVGVPIEAMVAPVAAFRGVGRRFQTIGTVGGVEVVDDFAHNPAKLEAALRTAQRRVRGRAPGGTDGRVLAVYQPHGYAPTRFLRVDFVETFARVLGPSDRVLWLEVFYAGGTTQRDFSSADIISEIAARGVGPRAEFAPTRDALTQRLATEARPGDLVLIMGARDPSLTDLARSVVAALASRTPVR
ncbi:MAG: UDP-N-acetylmuramate--L-alanine ligase [Candidatus Eiseniibacteriota bacterium]